MNISFEERKGRRDVRSSGLFIPAPMTFEMRARKRVDESTLVPKPAPDTMVVKHGQSNGSFPDPPCADESGGFQVFRETNDLVNQLVAPKASPRRWRRQFSRYAEDT
jgi:hypothetical protein